jgi:hypothetical protein
VNKLPRTELRLWRDDAIALWDWLSTVDLDAVPITHSAHKQALLDLHNYIEDETDLPEASPTEIERAKAEAAKDMGW